MSNLFNKAKEFANDLGNNNNNNNNNQGGGYGQGNQGGGYDQGNQGGGGGYGNDNMNQGSGGYGNDNMNQGGGNNYDQSNQGNQGGGGGFGGNDRNQSGGNQSSGGGFMGDMKTVGEDGLINTGELISSPNYYTHAADQIAIEVNKFATREGVNQKFDGAIDAGVDELANKEL